MMMAGAALPYTGSPLDRCSLRRQDAAWVASLWQDATFLGLHGEQFLLRQSPAGIADLGRGSVEALGDLPWVFLGLPVGGRPIFAVDLSGLDAPPCPAGCAYVSLRSVWQDMDAAEAAIVAQARGVLTWRSRHRFCSRCGSACQPTDAGHALTCPNCRSRHFPRTDAAVIMLISHQDRVLLARRARNPAPVYSVLAGFVEPGETLEEAVAREVLEEVGLRVDNIVYQASQPWPFPASLMIGFTAEARDTALTLDPNEIQDARWCTRAALSPPNGFELPQADSISSRLIAEWIAQPAG